MLRISFEGQKKYLEIPCADVQYMKCPTKWKNVLFEIEKKGTEELVLYDKSEGVEIRSGLIGAIEI